VGGIHFDLEPRPGGARPQDGVGQWLIFIKHHEAFLVLVPLDP
jgi:hypothetical protein